MGGSALLSTHVTTEALGSVGPLCSGSRKWQSWHGNKMTMRFMAPYPPLHRLALTETPRV